MLKARYWIPTVFVLIALTALAMAQDKKPLSPPATASVTKAPRRIDAQVSAICAPITNRSGAGTRAPRSE